MKADVEATYAPLSLGPAHRWKWMATSSAAAGVAAAPSVEAATVQINLIGNQVSSGSNNFSADFTGDGIPDGPFVASASGSFSRSSFFYYSVFIYNTFSNTFPVFARTATPTGPTVNPFYSIGVGTFFTSTNSGPQGPVSGLFPIVFADGKFNGGAASGGWIEFRAFNSAGNPRNTIRAVRMVFDDASTTRPGGVSPGGSNFVIGSVAPGGSFVASSSGNDALKKSLRNKIKKLKKKIKKAATPTKKKRLKSKLKRLKKRLKALN